MVKLIYTKFSRANLKMWTDMKHTDLHPVKETWNNRKQLPLMTEDLKKNELHFCYKL